LRRYISGFGYIEKNSECHRLKKNGNEGIGKQEPLKHQDAGDIMINNRE